MLLLAKLTENWQNNLVRQYVWIEIYLLFIFTPNLSAIGIYVKNKLLDFHCKTKQGYFNNIGIKSVSDTKKILEND